MFYRFFSRLFSLLSSPLALNSFLPQRQQHWCPLQCSHAVAAGRKVNLVVSSQPSSFNITSRTPSSRSKLGQLKLTLSHRSISPARNTKECGMKKERAFVCFINCRHQPAPWLMVFH
jgi:hypothetical protein